MKVKVGPSSNVAFQPATDRGSSAKLNITTNNATKVVLSTGGGGGSSAAAYDQANDAYLQANTARVQANTARDQANTARTTANDAYAQANTSRDQANTARTTANDAYAQANTARTTANDAYFQANTARTTANDSYEQANNARTTANNAYNSSNIVYAQANTAYNQANDAYSQANTSYAQANAAYAEANNRVLKSGDTMTGQLNISSGGLLVTGNSNFDSGTFFVDSVKNTVGIGTTTPSANLTVIGIANVTNTISTNTVNFGFGVYDLTSNSFQSNLNTTIEVDSFPSSDFSTVKYIVQVKTGSSLHATELFCIQDGIYTYMTEYATLISGSPLGSFSIELGGGRMKLNFEPDNPLENILNFKVVRYTISS